ncbi:MAG TPA: diaminobutyrate acetyltransferase [Candidatus Dietzia intestinipullorum]|nr:diaminobutyrate acetyltransferase [Candidatus Dietzia intestinipullorum]
MSLGEREVPRPQSTSDADAASSSEPVFRPPTAADGQRMWEITRDSGVLDVNSSYAYVLWGAEFSDSSVVVESEGRVVGFVTGFIRQSEPDTIFVWQVGVDADQRGKGLAARMLHALFDRTADRGVVRMRTTISPDNTASQRTFGAVARDRGLTFGGEDFLSADLMGEGHEPEDLYTLG